jgi:Holliday junction resolvase RusA-like endonuclease
MVNSFHFFCPGNPVPGGSKHAFVIHAKGCPAGKRINKGACVCHPRAVVSDDSGVRVKDWRHDVGTTGLRALRDAGLVLLRGPMCVRLTFYLPRPKGHYGAKGFLLPSAPMYPEPQPDVIKLSRAVEDALNHLVWEDDSRIISGHYQKFYASKTQQPGVDVTVTMI